MKFKNSKTLLLLAASVAIFSCTKDDENVTPTPNPGPTVAGSTIGGTLTGDLKLEKGKSYDLKNALIVPDGKTLTIEEGVTIKASSGAGVYIAIAQGGKIMAKGTANSPIVMTSATSSPSAGDWGGLIVLGKAPINSVAGGTATSTSEIGGLPYGGNVPTDNSGTIEYVRLEYSGGAADASSENNGFSFYGVGSGTSVKYIQAYEGKDDGIEFFGGTVNASYISVVGAQDDSVDWTEGFTGTLNHVYIKHGASHDKGIEADGFNTDIGNNSNPKFWSAPTVNNLTIVGLGSGTGNEAIRLRAGTRVMMNSVSIRGFQEGIDMDDAETGTGVTAGSSKITNISFTDVTTKLKNDTGATYTMADFISGDGAANTGTNYSAWSAGWTK